MSIRTIKFKDADADLAALASVCRELEDRGLPPKEAAAHVLASMANQAIANGMDARGVMDALHEVISSKGDSPVKLNRQMQRSRVVPLSAEQAETVRAQVKLLQNFLLYYDMILCSEIQRYAFQVMDGLASKGMYRHELKKYTNTLIDEARRLQMRVKDNDRALVFKWVSRMDPKAVYGKEYHEHGGSVVSRFSLSFRKTFAREWAVVELDCRTVAKETSDKTVGIVTTLLKLDALTNTGIELYDSCVKRMKSLVAGHGTASICKSTHHESMRCAARNLLGKLGVKLDRAGETERQYARRHLSDMQKRMVEEGMGDFFQKEFDRMGEEFAAYMTARMRMSLEQGRLERGGIRLVFERLGTKHRVRKFFRQLAAVPYPQGEDADPFDVADAIGEYEGPSSELNRFRKMCVENRCFELPESEETQECRMLRILARRNGGTLPDDIIRVMLMKRKTKKSVMEVLSKAGFELKATLRKIRRTRLKELEQM